MSRRAAALVLLLAACRSTPKAAPDAAPPDWPHGTSVGFRFEPAEERFRIPATIELPHGEGDGEVVCQSGAFARTVLDFEAMPASKPFPLHVSELPQRCAVYSPEHVRALKDARAKEAAQVQKGNDSFKWEIKGQICDPHD